MLLNAEFLHHTLVIRKGVEGGSGVFQQDHFRDMQTDAVTAILGGVPFFSHMGDAGLPVHRILNAKDRDLVPGFDISPDDTALQDNFSDAGDTYYTGYLAAAKRQGISSGVGGNLFAPAQEITRQELFTLLYNALKSIGSLPGTGSEGSVSGDAGKSISDFSDADQISLWAKDAMALLTETGTIAGSGGKLNPTGKATRAEMAQVLYHLLSK